MDNGPAVWVSRRYEGSRPFLFAPPGARVLTGLVDREVGSLTKSVGYLAVGRERKEVRGSEVKEAGLEIDRKGGMGD